MDDLVLMGTAGILALFLGGILFLYGVASVLIAAASALASGEVAVFLLIAIAVVGILVLYVASGLWLRKTDRI